MTTPPEWPLPQFAFDRATWMEHAACRGEPTNIWFPERGEPTDTAKAICAKCPVQAECLDYSLDIPNLVGVWGGASGRERREIKREITFERPIQHGTSAGYHQHRRRSEIPCDECRMAYSQQVMRRRGD